MNYRIHEKASFEYIEFLHDTPSLSSETDILDIIAITFEKNNYNITLDSEGISIT